MSAASNVALIGGFACITDLGDVCDSVLWWPSGKQDKIVSIDEENIFLWALDCPRKAAQVRMEIFSDQEHLKLLFFMLLILM